MALIVEDGSGTNPLAESYISVADATTYHTNRGNTAWTALASDTVREQCLRKATDYMIQVYRENWKGYRVSDTQALDFPRNDMQRDDIGNAMFSYSPYGYYYPNDNVPTEVKNACAELALKAASGDLSPDLTQGVKKEKIDVIEVEYDTCSPQYTRYRAIDNMLSPYLSGNGGTNRRVIRT